MVTKCRLPRVAPDERREHILTVAAGIFSQKGYGATSMSMIAAALGGSKATLYKYYPSKELLFEAMLQRKCGALTSPLHDMAGEAGNSPEDLLFAFGMHFLRVLFQPESMDVHRLIHSEGKHFPEIAEMFSRAVRDALCVAVIDALQPHINEGRLVLGDSRLAIEQFIGMVRGSLHQRVAWGLDPAPTEAELAHRVRHGVRIFMHGIAR